LPAIAVCLQNIRCLTHRFRGQALLQGIPFFMEKWTSTMQAFFKSCALALAVGLSATSLQAAEKVIFDTDFNVLNDDGQAFIMLAQLHAQKKIDLLGMTLVSGNAWVDQAQVDALKAVERMGVEKDVGVYSGAAYPLLHDFATYPQEQALFGSGWPGAFKHPRPTSPSQLVAPPDGLATHTKLRNESAAQFIIDSVKRNPHEVTLLAVGPLTNLALAIRTAPEIVPLIKRIVYMGGAMEIPGNTTPAAEFNWWFDPEAARIVLRSPVDPGPLQSRARPRVRQRPGVPQLYVGQPARAVPGAPGTGDGIQRRVG